MYSIESVNVYVGGSPSKDVAISPLQQAGLTYHVASLRQPDHKDEKFREYANAILYVLDENYNCLITMINIVESILEGDEVYLVITDYFHDEEVQLARNYIKNLADVHGVPLFDTVRDAVNEIIDDLSYILN